MKPIWYKAPRKERLERESMVAIMWNGKKMSYFLEKKLAGAGLLGQLYKGTNKLLILNRTEWYFLLKLFFNIARTI